ncbi:MAG: TetR/AcrR family transcriptional regulator [Rhodoblastus sp.]
MKTQLQPELSIRAAQRAATHQRLLDAAVALLIKRGVAATTTVAVQEYAGVSRGTLLHHFPSHAELLAGTIDQLVRRNEEAAQQALTRCLDNLDPIDRAMRVLADAFSRPAYLAELELWTVARTNPQLRGALKVAERRARPELERVFNTLFAPLRDRPNYAVAASLSIEFVRGLALAGVLRSSPSHREQILNDWIWTLRILLDQTTAREEFPAPTTSKRVRHD